MSDNIMCPVCQINPAVVASTVDVYSDTAIECCEDCRAMLSQAKRYRWHHNMPKKFHRDNQDKLLRALEALMTEYDREYAQKEAK